MTETSSGRRFRPAHADSRSHSSLTRYDLCPGSPRRRHRPSHKHGQPGPKEAVAGSQSGSHSRGRLAGTPDGNERPAAMRPRSRTDLNTYARPRGYLRIRRLGVRVPPSAPQVRGTIGRSQTGPADSSTATTLLIVVSRRLSAFSRGSSHRAPRITRPRPDSPETPQIAPGALMSVFRRSLQRLRVRREHLKRLNASRSEKGDWSGPSICP